MGVAYVVFIKPDEPVENLVTSPADTLPDAIAGTEIPVAVNDEAIAESFLSLLLSVKNIKLDDSIFREVAWSNLVDSSIELVPLGDEGRPNPFAPLGVDVLPVVPVPLDPVVPVPSSPVVPPPAPQPLVPPAPANSNTTPTAPGAGAPSGQ